MRGRYEAFCLADRLFFDRPVDGPGRAWSLRPLGAGWRSRAMGEWLVLTHEASVLPQQGWKVHISATPANAELVLGKTYEYCRTRSLPFKHLRSPSLLLARNAKYAPRAASGKLITLYPPDDDRLAEVLEELSEVLHGEPGPYILSDLRYGSGPLYVRYGAFVQRWTDDGLPAIATPDGTLVPDVRKPAFTVPDWVDVPPCLRPHLAARASDTAFPYRIDRALHYSNGGGVYLSTPFVIKEARPHAGLDHDLTDAVTRLDREHDMLTRLAGVPGIPAVHGRFSVWEHQYLAVEHRSGIPLGSWMGINYPLGHRASQVERDAYTARAVAIGDQVEAAIAAMHDRGVVWGDLHGNNILVDDSDTVSLLDFELAFMTTEASRPALGASGFRAPNDRHGTEIDLYALAALRLWLFFPLTAVLELEPGKLHQYLTTIEREFLLPAGYVGRIRSVLRPRVPVADAHTELDGAAPNWDVVGKSIAEAILASATPERADRLFPGDLEQFTTAAATFAHGAAGVIYALDVTGHGRHHEAWLLEAIHRDRPVRPGFATGAHGIAHVLAHLGHHDTARGLIDQARSPVNGCGLADGLAGIALTLLDAAGKWAPPQWLDEAVTLAERLGSAACTRAGLMHGWTGPALLYLRLYGRTGERRWLTLADQAIARDLEACVTAADGSTQVREGNRLLPYLESGSAGIAVVLSELARLMPDAGSVVHLPGLLRACRPEFVVHPGLHQGRAGLLAALTLAGHSGLATDHRARLAWHAVPFPRGGTAFPGNQLLRLSMDLATGGAGVLLALAPTPALPFLTEHPNTKE
ncbi:class III lanthionine synthetase LanKC [Actinokineospora globicatena]|uniref:Serine/threonine protein kinase n=1 Tax=Actinokineospora globicatena TaxID=103729 RepID=A0A9W6QGB3_9PSEU|nr:class III lanthionine synthetase LanKC [Actinokineospora globicatena]GLW89576.1 serine/threonine protein kinase [Actinokineospora globicatena]